MRRLVRWGYYLLKAYLHTRRADKWSDLWCKNREVTALDASEAHVRLSEAYLQKAEELYK